MIEGAFALLMLSVYFAYVIAPASAAVRRRVRFGRRQRPVSQAAAILYPVRSPPRHRPAVLADVQRGGDPLGCGDGAVNRGPSVQRDKRRPIRTKHQPGAAAGRDARLARARGHARSGVARAREPADAGGLHLRIAIRLVASHRAGLVAFPLLTGAPAFQRSALRVLPRGHLQWRAEGEPAGCEQCAGRLRAGPARRGGDRRGVVSVGGFLLLGLPSAVSVGVTTGVLELVPVIGPVTALLVTSSQASGHVLAVVLFFGGVRLLQDYVVYPRLIRHGMHLSTLAVILTIWCGAALARAPGVLLAIPVAGFLFGEYAALAQYRDIERLVHPAHPRTERSGSEPAFQAADPNRLDYGRAPGYFWKTSVSFRACPSGFVPLTVMVRVLSPPTALRVTPTEPCHPSSSWSRQSGVKPLDRDGVDVRIPINRVILAVAVAASYPSAAHPLVARDRP